MLLAVTPPRADRGGIVVRADSPIRQLAALAGRGIAVMPSSWHPELLIEALRSAGLRWRDVTVVELNDATARAALVRGGIDAWVVTDPTLATVEQQVPLRILASASAFHSNRSVLWGLGSTVDDQPAQVAAVLAAIRDSDDRIAVDPTEAAQLLAGSQQDVSGWAEVLAGRRWGLEPPGADFLTEQQNHADRLAEAGVLSRSVDLTQALRGPRF